MSDIVPELLDKIQEEFQKEFEKSGVIKGIDALMTGGTATYKEAIEYADEVGSILSRVLKNNLSSSVLPDGKLYYNISERVLTKTLAHNHSLIANVSVKVQTELNSLAGLGIKGIKPPLNMDKIRGFIARTSAEEKIDDVAWILDEPIINYSKSVVDDAIRTNAQFQFDAGLRPVIHRSASADACDWCKDLAGTYDYEEVKATGHPVFMRHNKCDCLVLFDPRDGRKQNVHTKKWG